MAEGEPQPKQARDNQGRPTTLSLYNTMKSCLDVAEDGCSQLDKKSPDNSRLSVGTVSSKPSPTRNDPPPGFRKIPSIQISPASPRSVSIARTPESFIRTPTSPASGHEYIRRYVCAFFHEFSKSKRLEWSILSLVESNFEGDKLQIFLDILFRLVLCETPYASDQRVAAVLVRTLILRGAISEAKVMDTLSNGIIKDLGSLLVLPQGVCDFAGFLTDLFLPEPDLKWLLTLTNNVPAQSAIGTELIHCVIQNLKQRIPISEVQKRVRRTLDIGWK